MKDVKTFRHETADQLLAKRIIMVEGDLTQETMVWINTALLSMDHKNHNEITLYFRSNGGHAAYGLMNYDVLSSLKSPTRGIVAIAGSAASVILMGCDRRCMLPSGIITIHSPRTENIRTLVFNKSFDEHVVEIKKTGMAIADRSIRIYSERTKMSKKQLEEQILKGDLYESAIMAKEALDFGLVDEILKKKFVFP